MPTTRLAPLLLQLVLASAALAIGWQIEPSLHALPHAVLGGPRASDPPGTLVQIVAWFLGCQLLSGGFGLFLRPPAAPLAVPGILRAFYAAVTGTALATLAVFLLTDLPFRSNLFAGTFLALGVLFALVLAAATLRSVEGTRALPGQILRSLPTPGFGAAALSLGVLLVVLGAFRLSLDVRNTLNHLRSREAIEVAADWRLTDRFEGARYDQPVDLDYPAALDGLLFLLNRKGQVFRLDAVSGAADLVLDFGARVIDLQSENGALALALHPDFGVAGRPGEGWAYVWYTGFAPADRERRVNRLARFDLAAPTPAARLATEQALIEAPRGDTGFHNGGALQFGPDGMLYLSLGDFDVARNGQDVSERLASGILRLDVDQRGGAISAPITRRPVEGRTDGYFIPRDNPFFDVPGALQEYWAIGLRNPFRMWLDPERPVAWVGDVGDQRFEEVDLLGPGGNGQWPRREGPEINDASVALSPTSIAVEPLHHYRQTSVLRAVIGGPVYRGTRFPELAGQYLFADNQAGVLFRLDPADTARGQVALARAPQLASYGITSITEAPDGNLLVTTLGAPDDVSGRILALGRGAAPVVTEANAADQGAELYQTYCVRCHGDGGRGGPATEDLAARPDFTAADWQQRSSDDHIMTVIRAGGEAAGLSGAMPAWGEVLDEAELQALLVHLRGFGDAPH
jgi:glucose/arabinose dehydrogenase